MNPEAYDAYLKGRYFFNRPSDENLKKSIAQFEEAVRLSPNFAPAYSGLSDAYLWAGYNEGVLTASEARPKAKAAAEKAIQLDDNSAEAHTSLAVFKLFYEYDWAGCEREFRRAFALNPNYAFAHDQFGLALALPGTARRSDRRGQARHRAGSAVTADPDRQRARADVPAQLRGRRRTRRRKAGELDPTYFFPPMLEGWIDFQDRKFSEAIPSLKKAKATGLARIRHRLARVRLCGVRRSSPRRWKRSGDLKKRSLRGEVLPFNLAIVHLGMGDRKAAIDYLERAHASDSQWMGWLKMDRMFDPLRSEPRFVALMRKLRLAQ